MIDNTLNDLKQRQRLTAAYASFSQSRGGLGKVLGGMVGLVVIVAGTVIGSGVLTAILTISATLGWLIGKELIRIYLYRPLGEVQEMWPQESRRDHLLMTGIVGLIAASVAVTVIVNGDKSSVQMWIYLAFVVLMPFLTWFFLRTSLEFIVGVFLLAACAVHGAGGAYTLIPADMTLGTLGLVAATWSPFIGAFLLINIGLREHRHFQELLAQLQGEHSA